MKKMMLVIVMLMLIGGCVKVVTIDPNGIAHTSYAVDVNAVTPYEAVGGIGYTISMGLSTIWPIAGVIAGIIGTLLASWKKYKPQLQELQKKESLAYNATTSLVGFIEELKKTSPDVWEKLKGNLKIGPEVENVIRAIRGKPPIV